MSHWIRRKMILSLLLSITVALVDTGVDATHPTLSETSITGWNVIEETTNVLDLCGHGTGVAQIVAREAPDASLMILKSFRDDCYTDPSYISVAIQYAHQQGADIILVNAALSEADAQLVEVVEAALADGVIIVAAAGNYQDDAPRFPAALPGVIGVGGSEVPSAHYPWVKVSAQSRGVVAARAGGGYKAYDGTSFATPLIAGRIAHELTHSETYIPRIGRN
jgi:subtilisin family serine protease